MIGLPVHTQVWLAAGHTDLRRGFDGLAGLVQAAVGLTLPPAPGGAVDASGGNISVGTRILMSYDLAGIEAGMESDGPLARAGAPRDVIEGARRGYGADRVDHLGAAPAFGPGNYCCRLTDPDGYLVEVCVAHN